MADVVTWVLLTFILIVLIVFTVVGGFFVSRVLPIFNDINDSISNIDDSISGLENNVSDISIKIGQTLPSLQNLIAIYINTNSQSIPYLLNLLFNSNISIQQIKILLADSQIVPPRFIEYLNSISSSIGQIALILKTNIITPDQIGTLISKIDDIRSKISSLKSLVPSLKLELQSPILNLLNNINKNNEFLSNFIRTPDQNNMNIFTLLNSNNTTISQIDTLLANTANLDPSAVSDIICMLSQVRTGNSNIISILSKNHDKFLNIAQILNNNNIHLDNISILINTLSNLPPSTLILIKSKISDLLSNNQSINVLINQLDRSSIAYYDRTSVNSPDNINFNDNTLGETFQNVMNNIQSY